MLVAQPVGARARRGQRRAVRETGEPLVHRVSGRRHDEHAGAGDAGDEAGEDEGLHGLINR